MPILNSELKFTAVEERDRRAFRGRIAQKKLFQSGHKVFKFTDRSLVNAQTGHVSPWWSSVEPVDDADPGLQGSIERAESLGVSTTDFARARNAVTKEWNSMSGLLVAQLRLPVYGFVGKVAAQPIEEGRTNVVFIGGATQVWIPNLTAAHIKKV